LSSFGESGVLGFEAILLKCSLAEARWCLVTELEWFVPSPPKTVAKLVFGAALTVLSAVVIPSKFFSLMIAT